jgi:hypothetical protein
MRFENQNRKQVYGWLERVLVEQEYVQLGKAARGLVRRYIEKMTGLSRAQVTRPIARYTSTGRVQPTVYRRRRFPEPFIACHRYSKYPQIHRLKNPQF